jgi:hypothetical protein
MFCKVFGNYIDGIPCITPRVGKRGKTSIQIYGIPKSGLYTHPSPCFGG